MTRAIWLRCATPVTVKRIGLQMVNAPSQLSKPRESRVPGNWHARFGKQHRGNTGRAVRPYADFTQFKGPAHIRPMFLHKQERIEGLVFVAMLALLVYTILEMLCRRAGQWITARQVLHKFERLGAVYLQFGDGSVLKLPSALNAFQGQLIELLRFPEPAAYLRTLEDEL